MSLACKCQVPSFCLQPRASWVCSLPTRLCSTVLTYSTASDPPPLTLKQHPRKSGSKQKREFPRRGTALLLNLQLLLFLLNLACTWCLRLKFLLSTSLSSSSPTYLLIFSYLQILQYCPGGLKSYHCQRTPILEDGCCCVLWTSMLRLSEKWDSGTPITPYRVAVLFLSKLEFNQLDSWNTWKVQL